MDRATRSSEKIIDQGIVARFSDAGNVGACGFKSLKSNSMISPPKGGLDPEGFTKNQVLGSMFNSLSVKHRSIQTQVEMKMVIPTDVLNNKVKVGMDKGNVRAGQIPTMRKLTETVEMTDGHECRRVVCECGWEGCVICAECRCPRCHRKLRWN